MSERDLDVMREDGSVGASFANITSSSVTKAKTPQEVLPNNQNDPKGSRKKLIDGDIVEKIIGLLLMSFLVGLGFSIIVGPVFSVCVYLFSRGGRFILFSGFICGVMLGYLMGVVIGSIWFLLKEFKK